ncbi:hypothetical protein D9M71_346930 [compost metagenome]
MRRDAREDRIRAARERQRSALPARRLPCQPGHAARRQRQCHRCPAAPAAAAAGSSRRAARRRTQPALVAAPAAWRVRAGPAGPDRPADPAGRRQATAGHVQRHPAGTLPGWPEPGDGGPDDPGGALLPRSALRSGARRQDLRRGGLPGRGVPWQGSLRNQRDRRGAAAAEQQGGTDRAHRHAGCRAARLQRACEVTMVDREPFRGLRPSAAARGIRHQARSRPAAGP